LVKSGAASTNGAATGSGSPCTMGSSCASASEDSAGASGGGRLSTCGTCGTCCAASEESSPVYSPQKNRRRERIARCGGNGSRGALPLRRALHGAAGQSSSPWVWARCWGKCWACRADISSPAPAFSRCSHLLQRSGSGSPTRTRVCCRQELGSARYTRAMALGARVSVGLGCTCASCDSAQPSSERAPGSSQHVELLTRCSDVGCAT